MTCDIYIDGACRGNPGMAAIGIVIYREEKRIKEIAKEIGEATNNIAEYTALVYALQEALILKEKEIRVFTDSELVYRQVIGEYKIKNPQLKILFDQVQHLAEGFDRIELKHIKREKNKEADRLASSSLKKKQTQMVASAFRS